MITLMVVELGVYFLPSILALARRHQNKFAILLVNTLLGWTVVGWIVVLYWALRPVMRKQRTVLAPFERKEPHFGPPQELSRIDV